MKHIHFLGICGTAMASAAVMIKQLGIHVTGSDENVYPPMSTFLEDNQIPLLSGYSPENLKPEPDLVVIGNALSRGNPEVEAVLDGHLCYFSLPELLREYFIRGRKSIVITGTHGKTTTTSLVSWLLESAGRSPGFMVGGIPLNFGTSARIPSGDIFVCEGDEYDTAFFDKRSKFLNYLPEFVIINNIEFDHADIFDSLSSILKAFRQMVNIVPRCGQILVNGDDPNALAVVEKAFCSVETFGFSSDCDWRATNISFSDNGSTFDLYYKNHHFLKLTIPLFGNHNIKNAISAIGLLFHFGLRESDFRQGLKRFWGVKRRLESLAVINNVQIYDDFAHHPTAIQETLFAVRQKHPHRRIIALFDPRSNTAVRHFFQDKFPQAFENADIIILNDLHRKAKIPQSEQLQPDKVIKVLRDQGKYAYFLPDVAAILEQLKKSIHSNDVVVIMSNGGFDGIHQKLIEQLKNQETYDL